MHFTRAFALQGLFWKFFVQSNCGSRCKHVTDNHMQHQTDCTKFIFSFFPVSWTKCRKMMIKLSLTFGGKLENYIAIYFCILYHIARYCIMMYHVLLISYIVPPGTWERGPRLVHETGCMMGERPTKNPELEGLKRMGACDANGQPISFHFEAFKILVEWKRTAEHVMVDDVWFLLDDVGSKNSKTSEKRLEFVWFCLCIWLHNWGDMIC